MNDTSNVGDYRYYAKVTAGKVNKGENLIYINRGFTFQQFCKWRWYFEYRAALYKVQNPLLSVDFQFGNYPFVPTEEEVRTRLKNKIIGLKRTITKYENKLLMAKKEWGLKSGMFVFPIEDDEMYIRAVAKIERLKGELLSLENPGMPV